MTNEKLVYIFCTQESVSGFRPDSIIIRVRAGQRAENTLHNVQEVFTLQSIVWAELGQAKSIKLTRYNFARK